MLLLLIKSFNNIKQSLYNSKTKYALFYVIKFHITVMIYDTICCGLHVVILIAVQPVYVVYCISFKCFLSVLYAAMLPMLVAGRGMRCLGCGMYIYIYIYVLYTLFTACGL